MLRGGECNVSGGCNLMAEAMYNCPLARLAGSEIAYEAVAPMPLIPIPKGAALPLST